MTMTQTILLTGASGYIAKHIALKLLNAGYTVRGTVRDLKRADEVRDALRPHLTDPASLDQRLSFVALDLDKDAGWTEAMTGVDVLMHTASPFPLAQPQNEDDLIRPAVDGTLRALRAAKAAGTRRVVLTSSVVAIEGSDGPKGKPAFDETDWTDVSHKIATPYYKSKTLAEKAAWDFVRTDMPTMQLTTINPVLVLGPPLDRHFGTSIQVVERILRAKDPMLPRVGFSIVDVRDIAEMHLRALTHPGAIGERFIGAEGFYWFSDIARTIKDAFPDRKTVTRVAPDLLIRLLGFFDKQVRTIIPVLGRHETVTSAKAQKVLGMHFIPARQSVIDSAAFLIDNRIVR
jgi:dihydroflavonol-4-reductase